MKTEFRSRNLSTKCTVNNIYSSAELCWTEKDDGTSCDVCAVKVMEILDIVLEVLPHYKFWNLFENIVCEKNKRIRDVPVS